MEYIKGIKISDAEQIDAAGLDRREIAVNGASLILKEVFQHRFFHADPHPGNLFVLENNVIAPVDFGMTGAIDEETSDHVSALVSAIVAKDLNGLIDILLALGIAEGPVDRKALKAELTDLFDQYYEVSLKDVSIKKLLDELMTVIRKYKLRPPGDFVMMARALLLSEGVARELYPQFNIVEYMKPYVRRDLIHGLDPARRAPGTRYGRKGQRETCQANARRRRRDSVEAEKERYWHRGRTQGARALHCRVGPLKQPAELCRGDRGAHRGLIHHLPDQGGSCLIRVSPSRPCGLSAGKHPRHVAPPRHHSLGQAVVLKSVWSKQSDIAKKTATLFLVSTAGPGDGGETPCTVSETNTWGWKNRRKVRSIGPRRMDNKGVPQHAAKAYRDHAGRQKGEGSYRRASGITIMSERGADCPARG